MKFAGDETHSVLVLLTVPLSWKDLTVDEIARKLRQNESQIAPTLSAREGVEVAA